LPEGRMLRMDQVHVIRHKHFLEGMSIRRIAREMGISRNTVKKYVQGDGEPKRTEGKPRASAVREAAGRRIEAILEEWKGRTTEKQRVTGTRIHRQLVEDGYEVGITTVREYLAERRRLEQEVYIPLEWWPGGRAQVDFFAVTVDIGGERQKAWKFLMRLMYSGRDFAWLYERCNRIAFLDGHVRAFNHFGGVAAGAIYDWLTAAVRRRVGLGPQLAERFRALVSHYVFEPCFARPGEGHDKGGVEARGKGVRLQHLTPIPQGGSLEEISTRMLSELDAAMATRKDREGRTVAQRFELERGKLRRLPPRPFEARIAEPVVLNRQAMAHVEGADYSLPQRWQGLMAMAHVGVADIRFECRGQTVLVAKVARGERLVQYRHYRRELGRKPQAVRQVAPALVAQLGEPYGELWERLVGRYGEPEAARVLSRLVGITETGGEEALKGALEAILRTLGRVGSEAGKVVDVPASLRSFSVEGGSLGAFDALLQEAGNE
jgi:transposase